MMFIVLTIACLGMAMGETLTPLFSLSSSNLKTKTEMETLKVSLKKQYDFYETVSTLAGQALYTTGVGLAEKYKTFRQNAGCYPAKTDAQCTSGSWNDPCCKSAGEARKFDSDECTEARSSMTGLTQAEKDVTSCPTQCVQGESAYGTNLCSVGGIAGVSMCRDRTATETMFPWPENTRCENGGEPSNTDAATFQLTGQIDDKWPAGYDCATTIDALISTQDAAFLSNLLTNKSMSCDEKQNQTTNEDYLDCPSPYLNIRMMSQAMAILMRPYFINGALFTNKYIKDLTYGSMTATTPQCQLILNPKISGVILAGMLFDEKSELPDGIYGFPDTAIKTNRDSADDKVKYGVNRAPNPSLATSVATKLEKLETRIFKPEMWPAASNFPALKTNNLFGLTSRESKLGGGKFTIVGGSNNGGAINMTTPHEVKIFKFVNNGSIVMNDLRDGAFLIDITNHGNVIIDAAVVTLFNVNNTANVKIGTRGAIGYYSLFNVRNEGGKIELALGNATLENAKNLGASSKLTMTGGGAELTQCENEGSIHITGGYVKGKDLVNKATGQVTISGGHIDVTVKTNTGKINIDGPATGVLKVPSIANVKGMKNAPKLKIIAPDFTPGGKKKKKFRKRVRAKATFKGYTKKDFEKDDIKTKFKKALAKTLSVQADDITILSIKEEAGHSGRLNRLLKRRDHKRQLSATLVVEFAINTGSDKDQADADTLAKTLSDKVKTMGKDLETNMKAEGLTNVQDIDVADVATEDLDASGNVKSKQPGWMMPVVICAAGVGGIIILGGIYTFSRKKDKLTDGK